MRAQDLIGWLAHIFVEHGSATQLIFGLLICFFSFHRLACTCHYVLREPYIEASDDWLSKVFGVCQSSLLFFSLVYHRIVLKMEPDNFNISLSITPSFRTRPVSLRDERAARHGRAEPRRCALPRGGCARAVGGGLARRARLEEVPARAADWFAVPIEPRAEESWLRKGKVIKQ